MLATNSQNNKSRYLILAIIIILIVISTILYFAFFKSGGSTPPLTTDNIKEKPTDNTTIKNDKVKEELNQKNKPETKSASEPKNSKNIEEKPGNNSGIEKGNDKKEETIEKKKPEINLEAKSASVPKKIVDKELKSPENSYLFDLVQKIINSDIEFNLMDLEVRAKFTEAIYEFKDTVNRGPFQELKKKISK